MLEPRHDSRHHRASYDSAGHDRLLSIHPEDRSGDAWMISYMDIMTLLVTLFVLLLALGNPVGVVSDALATASRITLVEPPQEVKISAQAVAAAERIKPLKRISPQARDAALAVAESVAARKSQLSETAVVVAKRLNRHRLVVSEAVSSARAIVDATVISEAARAAAMQVAGEWRVREMEKPLPVIDGVEVSRVEGGINLRIQDHLLFDSGEAALTGAGESVTQSLVDIIERYQGTVSVEGHTDSVPINTARFPSNWELSSGRAAAILRYLNQAGVDSSRLRAVGYADTRPIESNDTRDGRAANRRVEVIIHEAGAS